MHCLSLWGYQSYMWYTGICADKNSYIQNKNKLNPTSRQDSELSLLGSRNAGEPGKCSTQGVERLREGMLFKNMPGYFSGQGLEGKNLKVNARKTTPVAAAAVAAINQQTNGDAGTSSQRDSTQLKKQLSEEMVDRAPVCTGCGCSPEMNSDGFTRNTLIKNGLTMVKELA